MQCKIKHIVKRIKDKINQDENTLKYYVAGEHFENADYTIKKCGMIEGSTIGPAFHMHFVPRQVLLMSRNPHLRKAGMVDIEGICSDVSYVCETKNDRIFLQELLPFLFQCDSFWEQASQRKRGSTNFFLNWSDFEEIEVNIPDISAQHELAEILWTAEDTRQNYKKLLQISNNLIFAKFVEMFGNIGAKKENWPYKPLSECCIVNPSKTKEAADLECSFIAMPSLGNNGEIDTSVIKAYSELCKGFTYFAENDVLFAKITPCMENGKGAVATGLKNKIGFGTTELHVLRPIENISNPYWLYIITMFDSFRKNAEINMTGSGGQRRVPKTYFDDVKVAVPPIELQDNFAKFYLLNKQSQISIQKSIEDIENVIKNIINENFNKEVLHV